jgi:hypothetical protein
MKVGDDSQPSIQTKEDFTRVRLELSGRAGADISKCS